MSNTVPLLGGDQSVAASERTPLNGVMNGHGVTSSVNTKPAVSDDPVAAAAAYAAEEALHGHSPPQKQAADEEHLGAKTISLFGSIVLNVNNLCGPGMLLTPLVYQQAGWGLPTVLLIVLCIVSSYACLCIIEAIRLIPGNERFEKRIEFSTVVHHYYGHRAYVICQCLYALSLQTLNIASIIACTQVMDQFFVFAFGRSYGLQFSPSFGFISTPSPVCLDQPWSESGVILTLGYMVVMATCMPLGFLNLDQNIYFQYVSFTIFGCIFIEFLAQFFGAKLDTSQVPAKGYDMTEALGQLLINFTFVTTIPSWLNEKKPEVSIKKAVWGATIPCSFAYFIMGFVGAMAYPNLSSDDANILNVMASDKRATLLTKVSVYIFSFGVVGLGVPLFSVVVRYNLYVGKVFGARWSAFWGVIFPWLVSFLLYQGNGFDEFVTWASLSLNGFINFLLPFVLLITARRRYGSGSLPDSDSRLLAEPKSLVPVPTGPSAAVPITSPASSSTSPETPVHPPSIPVRVGPSSIQGGGGSALNSVTDDAATAAKRLRAASDVPYDATSHTSATIASNTSGSGLSPTSVAAALRARFLPEPQSKVLYPIAWVGAIAITVMLFAAIGLQVYTEATQTNSAFVCQTWIK